MDCVIEVQVVPRSKAPGIAGRHGDGWKVRVAAPPEGGRANDAVQQVLADALGIRVREVAIVAGHTARSKKVRVSGLAAGEVETRLAAAAEAAGR